jgi:beta-lactamase class A
MTRALDGSIMPSHASFQARRPRPVRRSAAGSLRRACGGQGRDAKGQLLADLRRIEEGTAGRLGVSALRAKTGERVQFNANARYPMASTFKVPVAMLLLDQVDRGAVSLSQKVKVVAIYLSGSPLPVAQQEHAIAMASLALYRYATR